MNTHNQIKTITMNFSSFQGLKGAPFGLLLLMISQWANSQSSPGPNLVFPIALTIGMIPLYLVIDRFYKMNYGIVIANKKSRNFSYLLGSLCGIAALAAFIIDISFALPISTLGFVFSSIFMIEYFKLFNQANDRLLLIYPLSSIIMLGISLLSLTNTAWWSVIGFKSPVYSVTTIAGFLFVINSVIIHLSLENILSQIKDHGNE